MIKTESDTFKAASRSEKLDHDELDVSGDEFQDDDETPYSERMEDDDTKESKERIRREQLGANLFGDGDEQGVDKELQEQLREELERQKYGKSTKKALIKRDREDIYQSDDSEENPWSSSVCYNSTWVTQWSAYTNSQLQSDDESSGEDEEEGKEENKDDDKKETDNKEVQSDAKDKAKSTGIKGSLTPQGKQKTGEFAKKTKSLKRAGSPASESSGNESSRKKMKKSSTGGNGSRAGTPASQQNMTRRGKPGHGSGSDGEATAGDMSDGPAVHRKGVKMVGSSGRGTPVASRAGSPNPATIGKFRELPRA
jgi:transcription initiation factor TFIIF subunit alpha